MHRHVAFSRRFENHFNIIFRAIYGWVTVLVSSHLYIVIFYSAVKGISMYMLPLCRVILHSEKCEPKKNVYVFSLSLHQMLEPKVALEPVSLRQLVVTSVMLAVLVTRN